MMVYGSYYLVGLFFLFWAWRWLEFLSQNTSQLKSFLQRHKDGAFISLALVFVVFMSVTPCLRVTGDENDLLGVANNMTFSQEKRADMAPELELREGVLTVGEGKERMDFRPLGFPFISHVAAVFSGDRGPARVFVLNGMLLFILLFIFYAVFKQRIGPLWSAATLILVLSQPLVTNAAASAGYDLAAFVFLTINFVTLWYFLKAPSKALFRLLWLGLVLTALIRHEGPIYFVVIMGYLLGNKLIKKEFFYCSYEIFLTPLFLLPCLWQRIYIPFWGLEEGQTLIQQYSCKNIILHTKQFFLPGFQKLFSLPAVQPINLIGLAAIVFGGVAFIRYRKNWAAYERHWFMIAILSFIAGWCAITGYLNSTPHHQISGRHYLPFAILFALAASLGINRVRQFRTSPAYFFVLALGIFMLHHTLAVKSHFSQAYSWKNQYDVVRSFLDKRPNTGTSLLITNLPQQFSAGWQSSVINFETADIRSEEILSERRTYSEILVVQLINTKTGKLHNEFQLRPEYQLKTLDELQVENDFFIRFSLVEAPKPQASERSAAKSL